MPRWLYHSILILLLTGCAARVPMPPETFVCPAIPPEVECQDWPAPENSTWEALLNAYRLGEVAHASCRELATIWATQWEACHDA